MSRKTNIEILISKLEEISKIKNYRTFCMKVSNIMKELGWSYHDGGAFTEVFTKANVKYVIKLSGRAGQPFHPMDDYKEGYLKPIYMTVNRFLAIQDKVTTYDDYYSECIKPVNKAQAEYMRLQRGMLQARKAYLKAKEKHNADMKLIRRSNIKHYRKIPDLRESNIGLFNGVPLMIDLNNHTFGTYE